MLPMWLVTLLNNNALSNKSLTKIEPLVLQYHGKKVRARKLTVSSVIEMDLGTAWQNVKSPALLQFVAKGMLSFSSSDGQFPKEWELGQTYGVKMLLFGILPIGGTHFLSIKKLDEKSHELATREWDSLIKIWNHAISMKSLGNGKIYYEDSITIYAGLMTGLITFFAKSFYQHRQKWWQIVARENLTFA